MSKNLTNHADKAYPLTGFRMIWSRLKKSHKGDIRKLMGSSNETFYKYLNHPERIPVGKMHDVVAYLNSVFPDEDVNSYTLTETIK